MTWIPPGDKRGYTDFLTGAVHLLDLPTNLLNRYTVKGRLPSAFLPSFLHEATHFWCMASDLGATLALLELRAQREVALGMHVCDRLTHDLGASGGVHRMLKPLLEGMALFMEFEALPGSSDVLAAPGLWAGLLFIPLDQDRPNDLSPTETRKWIETVVLSALVRYRSSPEALRRKIDVLMQPLLDDPNLYLVGFLAVKQMWWAASTKTPAFRDRDLFLNFLRDWVFEDWLIIDHLLDDKLAPSVVLSRIFQRLQRRLKELVVSDLTLEVAEYDREIGSGSRDPRALARSLRIEESEVGRVQAKYRHLLDQVEAGLSDENEHRDWFFADYLTFRHRNEMMRLALEPVEVEVNEHDRVIVRRNQSIQSTYIAGPAPDGAARGTTRGWMTVYFLPDHRKVISLAVREDQPMIWIPLSGIDETLYQVIRSAVTKVVSTQETRREIAAKCRDIADQCEDADYDLAFLLLDDFVPKFFAEYALTHAPEDKVEQLTETLRRRGLYDLLEKDGDLLTALAHISMYPVLGDENRALVAADLRQAGIDLDWALERLLEVSKKGGLPLIAKGKDNTIWCLV